jgi:hypothetical protein
MFHMGVTVTLLLLPVIGDPLLAMMQSLWLEAQEKIGL